MTRRAPPAAGRGLVLAVGGLWRCGPGLHGPPGGAVKIQLRPRTTPDRW